MDRDGSREEFAAERGPRAWNAPVMATPTMFTPGHRPGCRDRRRDRGYVTTKVDLTFATTVAAVTTAAVRPLC